jgi:hypothetical protein
MEIYGGAEPERSHISPGEGQHIGRSTAAAYSGAKHGSVQSEMDYFVTIPWISHDRTIALMVSGRLPTAAARVRSEVRSSEICGG